MARPLAPAGQAEVNDPKKRRGFIGGSGARIILGDDEQALLRLWREKRGEVEPKDLSGNLVVQLGAMTRSSSKTRSQGVFGGFQQQGARRSEFPP